MALLPDTRPSLLLRLPNQADEAAWERFVAMYRPVIVRLAEMKGLAPHDAEDLAQQVLISVSKGIASWEHDPRRARFRTWLARVVRNATLNAAAQPSAKSAAPAMVAAATLPYAIADA